PAAERERVRPALEGRQRGLQRLPRRVPAARVVVGPRLAHAELRVRRGLEDRNVHRAVLRLGVLPRVDGPCLELEVVDRAAPLRAPSVVSLFDRRALLAVLAQLHPPWGERRPSSSPLTSAGRSHRLLLSSRSASRPSLA